MALLIKSDGSRETIRGERDGKLTYEQIRKAIGGGYVEHVETDPAQAEGYTHVYLDEEGKLKSFPPNPEATKLSVFTMPNDTLVGDVLFCTDAENME